MSEKKKKILLIIPNKDIEKFLEDYRDYLGLNAITSTINFIIAEQMRKFYDGKQVNNRED